MPIKDGRMRIDFVQEILSVDEKTRKFTARLIPDPRRYELRKINDEDAYFDKFDGVYFPLSLIKKMVSKMVGMPIYYSPPKIDDPTKYVMDRKYYMEEFLKGNLPDYNQSDDSQDYLKNSKAENYIILSFDLVGSTKLSQELSEEKFSQLISLLSREITLMVHQFNGFILKFMGDGCVCYFSEPNFIGMHDNAIYCATAIKLLINEGINPTISKYGFPEISFRIGLDSGKANNIVVGAEELKQTKDLIGETINIACKIQAKAKPNEIYVGESVAQNVHLVWRRLLSEMHIDGWEYKAVDGKPYKIYKLNL